MDGRDKSQAMTNEKFRERGLAAPAVKTVGAVIHRQHDNFGTDADPRIEIGDVFIGEADAAGRDVGADGRWRVGAMNAIGPQARAELLRRNGSSQ